MKNSLPAGDASILPALDTPLSFAAIEHQEISKTMSQIEPQSYATPVNRLLAALPETDYQRLLPQMQPVLLHAGQVLLTTNTPGHGIYFLDEGLVATVLSSADGVENEMIAIGCEGMIGRAACVLGDTPTFRHAIVQIAGRGWWLPIEVLKREFGRGSALSQLLRDYLEVLLVEAGQTELCPPRHAVEARLCHWLLLLRDRAQMDELAVTQEFIADLIEARPSEVTVASGVLWKAGLIRFSNRRVTILDPEGLQQRACECAAVIRHEHERLLTGAPIRHAA